MIFDPDPGCQGGRSVGWSVEGAAAVGDGVADAALHLAH